MALEVKQLVRPAFVPSGFRSVPVLRAGAVYFAIVFSAGFLLGMLRVPILVPRLGVRTAELLEMPVMLGVVLWAARRVVRRQPPLSRRGRLAAGLLALLLLAGSELLLAFTAAGLAPLAYVASRDPVSGGVYLACLLVFAVAPACLAGVRGSDRTAACSR